MSVMWAGDKMMQMRKPIKNLIVNNMKRAEFFGLPCREWKEDIGEFDGLVILPTRRKHESGYMCMDYVACLGGHPICRLAGCSDVIHLNGIGGYGRNWIQKYGGVPDMVPPTDWNIDCLKSGLLRFFGPTMTCDPTLSSFVLYGERNAR